MSESFPPSMTKEFMARYGHLPKEFLPWRMDPKNTQTAKEWRIALTQQWLPAPHIPRGLKLRKGYHLQPPRFNFGWAMDNDTTREIAHRGGFPAFFPDSIESSDHGPILNWPAANQLLRGVLSDKFPEIAKEVPGIRTGTVVGPEGEDCTIIILTDSLRNGNRKPKQEHIDTLREFFGIGTKAEGKSEPYGGLEPMWWLDSFYRRWTWRYSWQYEAENGLRDAKSLLGDTIRL
ncbi:hypothetical protein CC1G_09066 [Coprinopsis cinerea okayama7|uniref:Uncharacterized protein n=1 Tax=Coprinopsis cinerea (strain Okayama-7 / 130 / ATCC MYA-4618 / FGSC 9003) TaxID=240176 RepID=A8P303_COPC7|nr:hypothetical protein CC1G_09066 [Coprinopsis cinerea okayama7\|eukprot:XP_001838438.2 hypothetical protein CC1G_09066 [Coprinopsis cinerea okayama7\